MGNACRKIILWKPLPELIQNVLHQIPKLHSSRIRSGQCLYVFYSLLEPCLSFPLKPAVRCQVQHCTYLHSPYGLIQRMKKFETEAIFFGRSLNQLARMKQYSAHPLPSLWCFVDQQHSRFQHTPQLGPAFQSPTNLKNKRCLLEQSVPIPWNTIKNNPC